MAPGGYSKTTEDSTTITWEKTHKNGDETQVSATKFGGPQTGDAAWTVRVFDPNGDKVLSRNIGEKSEAKRVAKAWMRENPKGNQGVGGLFMG